ncbi:MAG: DUF3387 domain-containing protein [Protaetiibacter sp.]
MVERIEKLIADYNTGSFNIDEYLRRLIELSNTLTEEERRAVREGMTEEELAIFDLLTKPDPVLTEGELVTVTSSTRRCGSSTITCSLASCDDAGSSAYTRRPRYTLFVGDVT